jgi:ABC-type uncharacterized transport system involved in gliding motility auxiliary subunit
MKNEKLMQALFIAGIVLLLLGSMIAIVRSEFEAATITMIALGAVMSGVYIWLNRKMIGPLFTSRNTRYGTNALIYSLIVIAIIGIEQAIFTVHTLQVDLTKNKKYVLSEQTMKILGGLKNDMDLYYFYSMKQRDPRIEDTMKQFEKASPHVKFQGVDADRQPGLAKGYNVTRYGVVVVSRKDNKTVEKVDDPTEETLINCILRLTRETKKKIYFTKGHGEPSVENPPSDKTAFSLMKDEMMSENYAPQELELFNAGKVPDDANELIIAGPQADFFDNEIKYIEDYLRHGGKVFLLYPALAHAPKLETLIKTFGVYADNDVIVDKISKMLGGDVLMPLISQYEQHEITKGFTVATMLPICRSFDLKSGVPGVTLQSLAKTNPAAWGETDLAGIKKGYVSNNAGKNKKGPLDVALIVNIDNALFKPDWDSATNSSKASVAVFGSSEFANNTYSQVAGNRDFFLNTVAFLAEEKDTIAIRPKDRSFEPLFVSKIQGRMLFILPTIFFPLLVLSIGVMVFVRRRTGK